jgi:hypothetical protein
MNKWVLTLGLITVLYLSAYGQIDTLNLVAIHSLALPGGNSNAYISNIDNDSTEEIIVCTQSNIYVYNYPALNAVWISPNSNWDNRPVFYDWNHDGHLDIGVADTSVKIFDISNNQLLWSSPRIDAYRGFSFDFGYLNGDSIDDAVIVRQGSSSAHDSMNVDIYYGPQMQLSSHHAFIPSNIAGGEALSRAVVAQLSGNQDSRATIILFSNVSNYYTTYYQDLYCIFDGHWGKIYVIDPLDYSTLMIDTTGYALYRTYSSVDSSNTYLYALTQRNTDQWGTLCHQFWYRNVRLWRISADNIINTETLFYNSMWDSHREWKYYAVGDIDYNNAGDEICHGLYDTLWLCTYPDFTPIWRHTLNTGSNTLNGVYHNNTLFSDPMILIPPYIINGSNGEIAAMTILSLPTWTAIKDFDHDGEDELFLGSGDHLYFYHLQRAATGTTQDNPLPNAYRLSPNYPNPFNPTTTIQFELPKASHVSLDIYDILGRKIATLVDLKQEAGIHSVIWNGSNNPSGLYFYRLKANDFNETKKMLLLK